MPSYLIKLEKDVDSYVYWSEVVEAPHCWGPREEVYTYMEWIGHSQDLDARFARADEYGTSSLAYAENYGWDDNGAIIYKQQGFLYRSELREFLESNLDVSLLHPFEEE